MAVARGIGRRLSTETKSALKTTEWWTFVVVFILILIAGNSIEGDAGSTDYFGADKVWLYITILTVGYMVSRGLAKSGSRDPYTEDTSEGSGGGIGSRIGAAASALREGESKEPSQPGPGGPGGGTTPR